MAEMVGPFEFEKLRPIDWSGPSLRLSARVPHGVPVFADRLGSMLATMTPSTVLPVVSACRPSLDGLYRLSDKVRVTDEGAGAADVSGNKPTPMTVEFQLERMRSAVHRTQLSSIERPSAIAWSSAKEATYGVPGTPVNSNKLWAVGAVNTGRGILTTVDSRDGGWVEWVADAERYYDGAAMMWTAYGDPTTYANRVPITGNWSPMGHAVVVGNYVIEVWIPTAGNDVKIRQWTGPAIGGSWGAWRSIEIYGAAQSVRAWTVNRNDPDRVSITAERVADLTRGCRITVAIHRGSSHAELTITGEPYALQCPTAQNSSASDGGGLVWMREADGIYIMGDSDGGLAPDSTSPLRTRGIPLGGEARYGLALTTRGVDEWAIFGDQWSRPVWGDV